MTDSQPRMLNCLIVGGVADGVVLREVRDNATWIELRRPDYLKPLEHSKQEQPEAVHESDRYQIFTLHLERGAKLLFGGVEGMTFDDVLRRICIKYVEKITDEQVAAGLRHTQ